MGFADGAPADVRDASRVSHGAGCPYLRAWEWMLLSWSPYMVAIGIRV